MRNIVRHSLEGERVCAFNQYYKSKICGDVLKFLPGELKVERVVFNIIEADMKYKNDHSKIITEEYEIKFDNYRQIDEEEMQKYINKYWVKFQFINFYTSQV